MSFRHRSTSNRKRFSDTRVSDAILFEVKMIEDVEKIQYTEVFFECKKKKLKHSRFHASYSTRSDTSYLSWLGGQINTVSMNDFIKIIHTQIICFICALGIPVVQPEVVRNCRLPHCATSGH